tara:strand:- start:13790 stop:15154 length:1365 start_codon:yes stop_codon:yes gene_type:complete
MIEKTILRNLLKNEAYARKTLPFIEDEYFAVEEDRIIFTEIKNFIVKYNTLPSFDALYIEVDSLKGLSQDQIESIRGDIDEFRKDDTDTTLDWLIDTTEQFCQDKAIYHAIMKSIDIMNNKGGSLTKGAIPDLLKDALSVSFDPNVGLDYLENADAQFDYYHRILERMPFDLEYFNKITNGGIPKKTLNVALAGTGVGKSLFMCHVASNHLVQGKNVLYITLELSEEEVAKRVDANLMDISMIDLMNMPKPLYDKKSTSIRDRTAGKLIIKEYPTAGASTLHFKALLNELALKKDFKPDIIFVDYINICISSRIKPGSTVNSYSFIKSIAEELRGMAVESGIPVFTATQTTRSGFSSSDVELTDTSESFGLPATADFMFALINSEELEKLNQIMVKQLKNRYGDPALYKRFVVGIDRSKMRLYDVEGGAQTDIADSGQTQLPANTNKFKQLKVV